MPQYLAVPVVKADIQDSVLASGVLQALHQVSVGAQASGQVKSLKFKLGDEVKKGQLVAEIDSLTQQNALRNANAALVNAQAQLRAQQATFRQAELNFQRQKNMLERDASARIDYETAEAALNTSRATIVGLQAQIEQAKLTADTAVLSLGYTKIIAPIDGRVVAIVTKEGQTVNASQSAPTILILAQLDTVTVKAQISEADVIRVKPGLAVYFTILGEPDQQYHAILRSVAPAPDSIATDAANDGKTDTTAKAIYYNGLFDVPNPDDKLRISMTAQVTIVLHEAKDALIVPSTALGERGKDGRYAVQVLDPKTKIAATRQIKVGINNNVNAQVLDGLKIGELVVIGQIGGDEMTTMGESASVRMQ